MKNTTLIVLFLFMLAPSITSAADFSGNGRTPTPPLPSEAPITKALINPGTASDLANAMDIPNSSIISASLGTSDGSAVGVVPHSLGTGFPSKGGSFAILATGTAATAETDNNSESTSTTLTGLNNTQGNDMVQLTLELRVPTGATCMSFDFSFYSEEFPEFVGTTFNDVFTAELNGTDLTIVGNQVIAPLNFAFDSDGNLISVNTVFGVTANTGTTYDGATPFIRANSPIDAGATSVTLTLSIQDLGDSIYDSAVFIDNFFWGIGVTCNAGTDIDSDGDSLLDDWEINGIDLDNDGQIDLDLPAMGADPQHKDIFLEIDYMVDQGTGGHTHKPKSEALKKVIEAFANAPVSNPDGTTGIRLHIDAGASSIMNPVTNETWGSLSQSNVLPHDEALGSKSGSNYVWTEFDQTRSQNFSVFRRDVFHYAIFAHGLGGFGGVSGIARGIPEADFIVSLGRWQTNPGTVLQQAGTLMHELGHTLGLKHGGDDHANYEPNYLSIMNYSFQMRGLRVNGVDGTIDYSRFNLPNLDELNLNEPIGLNGGTVLDDFGTTYFCQNGQQFVNNANDPIDWNCNSVSSDVGIAADINQNASQTVLGSQDNWANIIFNGGGIGKLGDSNEPPAETEVDEITDEEDAFLITQFAVSLVGSGSMSVSPGSSAEYKFTIKNTGESADTYSLTGSSTQGWADFSSLPSALALASQEEQSFTVLLQVPTSAGPEQKEELRVDAVSQTNTKILDSSELSVSANTNPSVPQLVSPEDGATGLDTALTFRWNKSTDPDGDTVSYDLLICENAGFTVGCLSFEVAALEKNTMYAAGFGLFGSGLFFSMVFIKKERRKKLGTYMLVLLMTSGIITLVGCSSGGNGGGSPTSEISKEIAGLNIGTGYHWKVTAKDEKGGTAVSETRTFTTE